jgi:hypothetical protein
MILLAILSISLRCARRNSLEIRPAAICSALVFMLEIVKVPNILGSSCRSSFHVRYGLYREMERIFATMASSCAAVNCLQHLCVGLEGLCRIIVDSDEILIGSSSLAVFIFFRCIRRFLLCFPTEAASVMVVIKESESVRSCEVVGTAKDSSSIISLYFPTGARGARKSDDGGGEAGGRSAGRETFGTAGSVTPCELWMVCCPV